MRLNSLLVVTIRKRETVHLATNTGCWVKGQSHVKHGVMTVVFLMDRTGYPVLVDMPFHPYIVDAAAQNRYLHVVRH